jgi:hypothetical protein
MMPMFIEIVQKSIKNKLKSIEKNEKLAKLL